MCMQCLAESTILLENPLPGYVLVRAKKSIVTPAIWNSGEYGLVQMNDPDFIWPGDPIKDPFFGISDEQLDLIPNDDPIYEQADKFIDYIYEIDVCFKSDPKTGFLFYNACIQAGFDNNSQILPWFINHLAVLLDGK